MSEICYEDWEPVIGLEIHVQLKTCSKLFSPSANCFGGEPNTYINEIDTGQPGSLPLLNKEAVDKAILLGLGVKATIALFSTFDRKSYFYPDNPRNFQITQFFRPLLKGGVVTCDIGGETRHFKINRAHLEDDTGMLKHFSSFSGVDYNRAGTPLIEIVSEPMMHSPKEAVAYATSLRTLLQYLNVADANMEEGGMRMDVNISVRKKAETELRPKIEVKNMNSFYNMSLAIEAEIRRQIECYCLRPDLPHAEAISAGTYKFDVTTGKTILMRRKEKEQDYRYVHEPDLVPIVLTPEYIDSLKEKLPELPHERYLRYIKELKIAPDSAAILITEKFTSDFFEEALVFAKNPTALCNWIIVEFAGRLKEKGLSLKESKITPRSLGILISLIETQQITGKIAKLIADEMLLYPEKESDAIFKENPNYHPISDEALLNRFVEETLEKFPESIRDFQAGKTKALAFLVGQVMQKTQGKASPEIVNTLFLKRLKKN